MKDIILFLFCVSFISYNIIKEGVYLTLTRIYIYNLLLVNLLLIFIIISFYLYLMFDFNLLMKLYQYSDSIIIFRRYFI